MKSFYNSLKSTILNEDNKQQQQQDSTAANSASSPNPLPESYELKDVDNPVPVPSENVQADGKAEIRPAAAQQLASKFLKMAAKASANISTIVNEKTIGNIEKERLKFIGELQKEKNGSESEVLSHLISNPEAQKHIISISTDAKNFTEDPPIAFHSDADIDEIKANANELFKLDPRLKEIRFALVPKQITEENFWRNYAYKLSLVKKVLDDKKNTTEKKEAAAETEKPVEEPKLEQNESICEDESLEKELLNDLDEFEVVNGEGKKQEEKQLDDDLNEEIDALLHEDGDGK